MKRPLRRADARRSRLGRALLLASLLAGCRTRLLDESSMPTDGAPPADTGLPTTAPWPMEGHDPRHTGRSEYVGPRSGTIRWRLPLAAMSDPSSPTIARDGTIYVGARDTRLHAVDPSGHERWSFTTGDGAPSAAALADDGTIVFGRIDGSAANPTGVYALDAAGTLAWKLDQASPGGVFTISGAPTRAGDVVYFNAYDDGNELCAIGVTGQRRWCATTSGPTGTALINSPAVDADGNVYVATAIDGALYSFDASGRLRWRHATMDYALTTASVGEDGTIYVCSSERGSLRALHSDGTEAWQYPANGLDGVLSAPALAADGTVYFAAADGLHAVDGQGAPRWQLAVGRTVAAPIVDAEGTIFVGALDGKLHAVGPDGQARWVLGLDAQIASPAALGADGTLYVTTDGSLYAIGP